MAAKIRRQYAGAAAQTSITSAITAGDTSVSVASTTGWPSTASVPFYVVIDPDTSVEEKCSVTISGSTLTLTRGVDGTVAAAHSSGATIYPVFTATDADEANELASKFTAKGDLVAQGSSTFTTVTVGANGTFLKADSGASAGVSWDAIDLGTDTTGNYVATIAGTSNQVTVSGSGSESAAVTLSTPQDIHTGATPTFAGAILSGSSSGDLLRITQTGAGNALLVEDSTNPDATPFVISASGQMFKGHTESSGSTLSNVTPASQFSGTTTDTSSLGLYNFVAGSAGPSIRIFKSRSGTVGKAAVQSGDTLAFIEGLGADGTNFIPAASILVSADGSPATNSVPGRIVFATNSGGTTTTERMRIDSAGQVGIGATPTAGRNLIVGKALTGSTLGIGVLVGGTVASDVTSDAVSFRSNLNTSAASFTVTNLIHFDTPGVTTPGSGSTITNQIGFRVTSALTGATNNYGFFGDIASGTGRYNLHMGGTADNYMAGRLGVGATLTSSAMVRITNTTAADVALIVKGAAGQTGALLNVQNSASTSVLNINSVGNLFVGNNFTTGDTLIKVGSGRTDNGYSYVDLIGDTTYTDYGLRLIRYNLGANSNSILTHRGTGNLIIRAQDAGNVTLETQTVERMRLDTAGNVLIGMTTLATSSSKTLHIGNGTAPTANPTGGGVLYVESGALKYRGSSGTVTTIANA